MCFLGEIYPPDQKANRQTVNKLLLIKIKKIKSQYWTRILQVTRNMTSNDSIFR